MQRLIGRLAAISDVQLFALTVAWGIGGGLLLQFVVLPHLIPQLHWGHGLIAGLDWTAFHNIAFEQSLKIRQEGWGAWELRPQGQSPAGIASALYVLIRPEPWVVLPLNAVLFATAVVAIRRMLAVIYGSSSMATLAVLPFFAFASFVPIWGQLHKDVASGAGLCLVLTALVLARNTRQETAGLVALSALVAGGMGLLWVARPYSVFMALVATAAFIAPGIFGRSCQRMRLTVVALMVPLAALISVGPWGDRKSIEPMTVAAAAPPSGYDQFTMPNEEGNRTPPSGGYQESTKPKEERNRTPLPGLPRTRRLPQQLMGTQTVPRNYASCAPAPTADMLDRLLFSVCMAREGFKNGGERAGSNHDYDIRMRSLEDVAAYAPRAIQLAVIEPWPNRWGMEQSDIGRLGRYVVPFEMVVAYCAFGLAIVFGGKRLRQADAWGVVAFCLTYTAFFVYTMPNMGTVYRMRAYPFAIIVSLALGAFLTRRQESPRLPSQPPRSTV